MKHLYCEPQKFSTFLRLSVNISLLITAASANIALSQDQEQTLQSPYFIDGIHCDGLQYSHTTLEKNLAGSKDKKFGLKVFNQSQCENVFSHFGIEKLTWITPQDIELLTFKMNKSEIFDNVTLSLKKSELKNHVHLFGKFESSKGSSHSFKTGVEVSDGGDKQEGPRVNRKLSYLYQDKSAMDSTNFEIGFKANQISAPDSINYFGKTTADDDPIILTERDSQSLDKRSSQLTDLYVVIPRLKANGRTEKIEVHLISQLPELYEVSGDIELSFNQINYSNEWDLFIPWAIEDKNTIGIDLLYATVRDREDPSESDSVAYVGLKQTFIPSNNIGFKVQGFLNFYTSLGADSNSGFFDTKVIFQFGDIYGKGYHGLGVNNTTVKNALLPIHDFYFDNFAETDLYYRVYLESISSTVKHSTTMDFGLTSLTNDRKKESETYLESSPYVSVEYIHETDNLELGFSIKYQSQRTF